MDFWGPFTIRGQPGATGQVPTRQANGSVAWQTPGNGAAAGLVKIDTTSRMDNKANHFHGARCQAN